MRHACLDSLNENIRSPEAQLYSRKGEHITYSLYYTVVYVKKSHKYHLGNFNPYPTHYRPLASLNNILDIDDCLWVRKKSCALFYQGSWAPFPLGYQCSLPAASS